MIFQSIGVISCEYRYQREPFQVQHGRTCGGKWKVSFGINHHSRCRPTSRLQHTSLSGCRKLFIVAAESGSESKGTVDDEPEAAVLLVACAIGLATGSGVVLFNDVIHAIRHYAWQETPVEATHWGRWARQLPLASAVPVLVAPPVVGGLVVGALRAVTNFDEPLALKGGEQQGKPATSSLARNGNKIPSAPTEGSQAALRDQTAAASTSGRDFESASGRQEGTAAEPGLNKTWQYPAWLGPSWDWQGKVQARAVAAPVLRAMAAAITLGSGASLGPEGPSVDIGRSSARALGSLLRSKRRLLLPLIAAGSGAGVAAGFNAPISGVFFAVESVLQRPGVVKDAAGSPMSADSSGASFSSALTVAMILLASVVAAVVSQAGLGASPAFRVPEYELQSMFELPLVLVLGAVCGIASSAFKASSQVSDRAFRRLEDASSGVISMQAQHVLWPFLGGLATGVVALAYPEVLYQGFGNVNAILEARGSDYAPLLLLQIVAAKILTTAVCQRSGLVGGIYAPSIFMGAALGSAFGGIAALVGTPLGLQVTAPQAYALVGVAGMLAALCQVPLTAVLLLFELTHDYFIIIPTLASVGISYWVASFPMAALLQPLSPVFRLWPSEPASSLSSSTQSAAVITEEVFAAVSNAMPDQLPLDQGWQPSDALPQPDVTQEASQGPGEAVEVTVRTVPRASISKNGLMKAGHPGRIRSLGRGGGASVSFSGSPVAAAEATANGRAPQVGDDSSSSRFVCEGVDGEVGLVGSLPMRPKDRQVEDLTVLCALRQACVMLTPETSLGEALQVMDEAGESVAMVLDDTGSIIGVLTRASVVEAQLAAQALKILPESS
ncbi:probable H(+)/Cl(-) exchange transporter ClcA [Coccomyxa sp. Obi]|nr:probable H(+)/Cl(-) exchange transporter ClcA [Coccomyxa sp. Obi]